MNKVISIIASMLFATASFAASNSAPAPAAPTVTAPAPAANPTPEASNEERSRIAICNRSAGGKAGADRKAYMDKCVKNGAAKARK